MENGKLKQTDKLEFDNGIMGADPYGIIINFQFII